MSADINNITLYVCIGNSDDKLTQKEWSAFVRDVLEEIQMVTRRMHGAWSSASDSEWQNYCWCIEIDEANLESFKSRLTRIRKNYKQDSISVASAQTEFI